MEEKVTYRRMKRAEQKEHPKALYVLSTGEEPRY
jgi:hypothetical protein